MATQLLQAREERDNHQDERQIAYTFIETQKQEIAQLRDNLERASVAAASVNNDLEQASVAASVAPVEIESAFSLPSYFGEGDALTAPKICDDYRPDGVNCKSAEEMLHKEKCDNCPWCSGLEVTSFRRIENRKVFERFSLHENQARRNLAALSPIRA